ncbi:hypothetical protein P168DRAFT_287230 [Aspergillus campestris IBT 28561]|uniref:VWFA domain-containing protein n=1 Tax=Aspergillus campestris (strain IBT 28561) TaxID=1392248 RepID=A0A2I1DH05_ASPC2|nr:uncharacterized protein P168DRAFT_287230 [Aspergillus campestris IBT 28561]PKY09153.1 hypothetical protein P168DRAFT_287230 [Aspergillus campestris IBT 28561]
MSFCKFLSHPFSRSKSKTNRAEHQQHYTPNTTANTSRSQPISSTTKVNNSTPQNAPSPWSPPAYTTTVSSPPPTTTTDHSPYAFLSEFDTVFIVDDSSSMAGSRWKEAESAIATIAPICTHHDQDGIDIYFLNHRRSNRNNPAGGYTNITTADDVREIFHSVHPQGLTPFGTRLHDLLRPYLRRVESDTQRVKPLNIIAITDGEFTDDAESVLIDAARRLDACAAVPWQVGVQFFQVGDDKAARLYLQALDDDLVRLSKQDRLRDIVDTVPWRGGGRSGGTLSAEGILKCVLGAVNRKFDQREVW